MSPFCVIACWDIAVEAISPFRFFDTNAARFESTCTRQQSCSSVLLLFIHWLKITRSVPKKFVANKKYLVSCHRAFGYVAVKIHVRDLGLLSRLDEPLGLSTHTKCRKPCSMFVLNLLSVWWMRSHWASISADHVLVKQHIGLSGSGCRVCTRHSVKRRTWCWLVTQEILCNYWITWSIDRSQSFKLNQRSERSMFNVCKACCHALCRVT